MGKRKSSSCKRFITGSEIYTERAEDSETPGEGKEKRVESFLVGTDFPSYSGPTFDHPPICGDTREAGLLRSSSTRSHAFWGNHGNGS